MDLKEFKAWFEGFCEGVKEAPSREQWEKVKEKVKELGAGDVNAPPVPYPVAVPLPYGWSYEIGVTGKEEVWKSVAGVRQYNESTAF